MEGIETAGGEQTCQITIRYFEKNIKEQANE